MKLKQALALGAAAFPMLLATGAFAQDAEAPIATGEVTEVQEVVVNAELVFRNRNEGAAPVLSYDTEYFQRFEPVSVGEMLKRVPGVTFTSDVLEFDGVSMRGLPPGYTQILINGRRAPGGEADRSFFVDRIPAELVERIEIVRAPTADQPSEGVGGTLNVVLKEGATLRGGFAKGGVLLNEDGEARPTGAIAYAGSAGSTSYWGALNYQGRRNPKEKVTDFYEGDFDTFVGRELQSDTRDGVDISVNGEVLTRFDGGFIRFSGLAVDTDRDEDETSLVYEDDGAGGLDLDEVEVQRERISQQTYALSADGEFNLGAGTIGFNLGWAGYRDDTRAEVDEGDDLPDAELVEIETLDIQDDEFGAGLFWRGDFNGLRVKAGVDFLDKTRDAANRVYEVDNGVIEEETPDGAIFTIEERRIDPYLRLTWKTGPITLDAGLRYETTQRDTESDGGSSSLDSEEMNPSLHLLWQASPDDQFRASIARTVRRPDYDLISPYTQEEEPKDDDDLIGNPLLENETAWGLDVGYERRLGRRGVLGVNVFYREVEDLIELVDTGATASGGGNVYAPDNIGDGRVWGVEVDFAAPLEVFGLPDTGVFFNYTWLDSEVRDPYTGLDRRFTNQPQNVFNVGFIHNMRAWGASFGASYYDRDAGYETSLDEDVRVDYDGDLEAFVEKRFGERIVLRLSAQNLLDKEKREDFRIYDGDSVEEILENRLNGDVEESERESERSGVLYQVTLRVAF